MQQQQQQHHQQQQHRSKMAQTLCSKMDSSSRSSSS
jgi:hypothetical protein